MKPLLIILIVLAACTSPAQQFDHKARRLGLSILRVQGTDFVHALYAKEGTEKPAGGPLHVYLDGDGTPVIAGLPADDPTPRNPLTLRLLALDPDSAIYLGRPCYHRREPGAACSPELWRFRSARDFDSIVWFGYSGGGTLAVLLAERFPETRGVVTIAANLDVAAWTRHHRYPPLAGSLDPAARPPLEPDIVQRHYIGAADAVVPRAARARLPQRTDWIEIAGFDHTCCWEKIWPEVLSEVAVALDRHAP
jgi:hypothetical protein